jgi:hypothetical protein
MERATTFDRITLATLICGLIVLLLALAQPDFDASAQQSPERLEELHRRLLPVFDLPGVVYTDADERTGKLTVGVENRGLATSVRARARAAGISDDLLEIVESLPIVRMATLRDAVRPLQGGLQIHFSSFLCTLGFNAIRGGTAGFVTNSHCTDVQGGVENTQYYQPEFDTDPGVIGVEAADPAYSRCIIGGLKRCRQSDSAFVGHSNGISGSLGSIAHTSGPNSGSLEITGNFEITAEGTASAGTVVNKIGRTTGWTQAPVTATCANVAVTGTQFLLLCQSIVTSDQTIVGGGDSGSAVFGGTGPNVTLYGILWGGSSDGKTFVYSPIANVEVELGALTTDPIGPTPTPALTLTPSPTPAASATPTLTPVPSVTPTPTSILCGSFPQFCGPTATPTPTPLSFTPTATLQPPTNTPTPASTATPIATATPTPIVSCNLAPLLCR